MIKKQKIGLMTGLIGSVALIPIISTISSCSSNNNKSAIAKQYILDYYYNMNYLYNNSSISLMNQYLDINKNYNPRGIDEINAINQKKLNGNIQTFELVVSPKTSSTNIPKVTFSLNIDLNTHIISYPTFKSTTLYKLGNPYDSGGDVALTQQLSYDNFKLLKRMISDAQNTKIETTQVPTSIMTDVTGRSIIYTNRDNIYSIMTIKYQASHYSNQEYKFLSIWNKKTNISTIPELQNKVF